jgi:hypothetical protein
MIKLVIDNENRQYVLETDDAISPKPVDFGSLACVPAEDGHCVYVAQYGDGIASVVEITAIQPHAVVSAVTFEAEALSDDLPDLEEYIENAGDEDEPEPGDDNGNVVVSDN